MSGSAGGATPLESIGYDFHDKRLLELALTHRSFASDNGLAESNERLEYLGDAVLSFVVAALSYSMWPDLPEGSLAKIRADVVREPALAEIAVEIGLPAHIKLSKSEMANGGCNKASILADTLEAVIGAIFLDCKPMGDTLGTSLTLLEPGTPPTYHSHTGTSPDSSERPAGLEVLYELISRWFLSRLEAASTDPGMSEYKGRLQEMVQKATGNLPEYVLATTGPEHARSYDATVFVEGREAGRGTGRSKKLAEQEAARMALDQLENGTATLSGSGHLPEGSR